MNDIKLPKKFNEKLKNTDFYIPALYALERFTKILNLDGTLFPEYTDHSAAHIQDVLNSAEKLINPDSYRLITPADVYVLTIATCLHDSAMTFNWSNIRTVIQNKKYNGKVFGYKDKEEPAWLDLWNQYKAEFSNYKFEDIKDIVGDNIDLKGEVMDYFPSLEDVDLKASQLKVAGEFVRRHHARLAHTVSVHGFPGLDRKELFHESKIFHDNLAGLVARSHHYSMRDMYNRLQSDQRVEYRNCHLIFLMSVLRIADLMQITSARTPLLTFKSKTFWSSFSENEWRRHLSVLGYKDTPRDPSCLSFEIEPITSVSRLYSIRSLFNYFQYELDMVWASLGEAYGDSPLSQLKIKYRRVSSELDSSHFVSELTFEPEPAEFRVDLSLIKKLITPLYGNLPEVGIRELLQNGLDSIRERQHIDPSSNYKVKINLYQESDGESYLDVIDDGCGMNAEIIRNYFLCIGSSFRSSKQWASSFSHDQKSEVSRSGRFGIGMLAGFILGDRIEVTTLRHNPPQNDSALNFSFTIDGGLIQLNRAPIDETKIGTKIRIKLKPEVNSRLRGNQALWQWYFQLDADYQEVEYFIDGNPLISNSIFPEDCWHVTSGIRDLFKNFKWGKANNNGISNNMLFVNNLKISDSGAGVTNYKKTLDTYDEETKCWGFDVLFPPVSLEDPNLNLPLNLARNGFSEENVPFGSVLYSEVISHYLNLVDKYDLDPTVGETDPNQLTNIFYGLTRNQQAGKPINCQVGIWGVHKKGFLFSDLALIKAAGVEKIYLVGHFGNSYDLLKTLPENSVIFKFTSAQVQDQYHSKDNITYREQKLLSYLKSNAFLNSIFGQGSGRSIPPTAYRLTISSGRFQKLDLTKYLVSNGFKSAQGRNSVSFSESEVLENLEYDLGGSEFIVTIDISEVSDCKPHGLLTKRWLSELDSPFLNKNTKMKKNTDCKLI